MMPATLARYWHTVRHLKPVQITARARNVLLPPPPPARAARPSPTLRPQSRPFVAPVARPPSMTGPADFTFLGTAGAVSQPDDWNAAGVAKLWLYNLHYFDDLNAADAVARTRWHHALIARWIRDNPPGNGNGWEPYPLSLRIVNWIKWSLAGNTLSEAALASLALQADALAQRIEWHLLGNHLLANAKALIFAGLFFSGPAATDHLARGLAIYRAQLAEQVLADGGHFELSPMYHAIILEDLLDVLNIDAAYGNRLDPSFRQELARLAGHMSAWLRVMTHPDGEISFFNDAAFGIAGSPAALIAYAHRLGVIPQRAPCVRTQNGLTHLPSSGYVRLDANEATAIIDCADIGPDYIPGHAHADTLSFEFSLACERLIVNGGTSVYDASEQRLGERSTRAHSTVEIDDESSSEVWGSFRVARRAKVLNVTTESDNSLRVAASHDGYRRLAGRNVHTRAFRLEGQTLGIIDRITGAYRHAVARYHFAAGVVVEVAPDGRSGYIETVSGRRLDWQSFTPSVAEPSHWHPQFGVSLKTVCLRVPVINGSSHFRLSW